MQREKNEFKWAIAARKEYDPEKMFPEFYPPPEAQSSEEMAEAGEVDYSGVEWQAPSDSQDAKEEFERIMAQLQGRGQITGDDLMDSPTTEPSQIEWTDWQ